MKLNIGIFCHASLGGSARAGTGLARQLARRGHGVHLFARTSPFGQRNTTNGITIHAVLPHTGNGRPLTDIDCEWPVKELKAFVDYILRIMADEKFDLLHFHYALPFAFAADEIKRYLGTGAPLIVGTLHGTDVGRYARIPLKRTRLARALGASDRLTTVSVNHARFSTRIFRLAESPLVIPNFVDLSAFHPNGRRTGGRSKIVHLSNFRSVKNPMGVARIFLDVRKKMDAELWLIGDGPELGNVKTALDRSEYAGDVRYWGVQHHVERLLRQTDLLVMTSREESFCLAALEAMACGVPVLATEVGGLPELVIHGETGFLFPAENPALAVRFALNLLTDPVQHGRMQKAAIQQARRFDSNRIVPMFETLYRDLLTSGSQEIHCDVCI